MGNLYFNIKMEHNVLGLANLLGNRFFVYYMLGMKDSHSSKFISGMIDWKHRYVELNVKSSPIPSILIILYNCRSLIALTNQNNL